MNKFNEGKIKVWIDKKRGNRPSKGEIDFLRYVLFPTIIQQCNENYETLMQDCASGKIMRISFYDIKSSCMFLDELKDTMVFTDNENTIYISYNGINGMIVFNLIDISKKELLKLNV